MSFESPPPPPVDTYPGGPAPTYANPHGEHPVQVSVVRPETQSRVLAFFSIFFFLGRAIMLLPATIVLYFVGIAAFIVAWIAQWAILFTGHNPEGMHNFVAGYLRWSTRSQAYMLGLTDAYPPFRLSP